MLNIRFETIGVSECASCGRPSTPRWIVVLLRLFHWSLVDVHETLRPIVITCKRNSICSREEKANHHCQPLWSKTSLSVWHKQDREKTEVNESQQETSLPVSSLESIENCLLLTFCHLHLLFFPFFPPSSKPSIYPRDSARHFSFSVSSPRYVNTILFASLLGAPHFTPFHSIPDTPPNELY